MVLKFLGSLIWFWLGRSEEEGVRFSRVEGGREELGY